jgi:biopolymer transport protein ExbD
MSTDLGTGDKKGVNVELNIVPFIDLMSCLTAFLLVTAVWVNTAQLDIKPAGKARDVPPCADGACDDPKLSVLVEQDQLWIGVSRVNDFEKIPKLASGAYDWARLEDRLRFQKKTAFFSDKTQIEIAAASTRTEPVAYQQLIVAMDVAVKAGFVDVGLTEPEGLSARPTL